MSDVKGFIEVTSIYDGKKACIRAECITAVIDNAPEQESYARGVCVVKPACRTIRYSGETMDVAESYDEICDMIYKAEL